MNINQARTLWDIACQWTDWHTLQNYR